jgi:hypothetical protein
MPLVGAQHELARMYVRRSGLYLRKDGAANWLLGENELDEGVIPDLVLLVKWVKDAIAALSHLRDVMNAH